MCYFLEHRVHEAGNFHAISRKSQLTVNLVHLSDQEKNEEAIQRAMEQVKNFDAEIIVLYMETKNIQLTLQQVMIKFILFSFGMFFFLYFDVNYIQYNLMFLTKPILIEVTSCQ